MKNLTKIFFAVAAGIFAFSCVADATDDLGVQVGGANGATVELSLSLEESRTQLGEKVDGLYPIYWSEGDKISVNGVESSEAQINPSNPASAVFAVVEANTYAVAYPAAPAGQVLFAEKQSHVAKGNTFASGVSTMFGYSDNANNIQLNHLTGVLKIGIKGEAVLSKAQISTVDRAPIAGAFDIDFQTGELTATAASKSVIEYSFGEGLQLSGEVQYIHVAVPAGEYDELYITLYEKGNSGNIMYATVKAGESKPLVAGNVREFNNAIVYVPNAKLFVIDSVEKLVAFKTAVEAEGSLAMDAILTEDIDMTGVEWTPIAGENYTNTLIGNGYAIKNLTAPLFGKTSASFKGLHLENVNITTTERYISGAMACEVTATDTVIPVVENCSVSGTVTVNNAAAASHSRYGTLVGVVYGVKVSDCVNNATFTITKPYGEGNKKDVSVGGVIGWIREFTKSNAAITYSELNNCVNNGKVSFNDATTSVDNLYIGGLTASSAADNKGNMLCNNTNNGEVSALCNCATALRMGGISGYAKGTAVESDRQGDKNVNYGKLVIKSGSTVATTYLGGITGVTVDFSHSNCHNYGVIELEEGATTTTIAIGGVSGQGTATGDKGDTFVFHDCTNNAAINVLSSSPENTAGNIKVGGITAYTQGDLRRVTNNKEGVITIGGVRVTDGKRAAAGAPKIGNYCVAGVCSYKTVDSMIDCTNHADIIMSGTINEKSTKTISEFKVSGIVCYTSKDGSGFVSDGTIKLTGTFNCEMQLAGSIGFHYNNIAGAEIGAEASSTKFEVSGACNKGLIIGGVVGFTYRSLSHAMYDGTINITKDATIGTLCYIGGCVGKLMGDTGSPASPVFQLSKNCGNIVINGTINCAPCVGGLVGYAYVADGGKTFTLKDLTNNGDVTVGEDADIPSNNAYICGGVGHADCLITSLTNENAVTFNGSNTGGNTYVAGCVGDAPDGKLIKGLFNTGAISCAGTVKTARLAGCAGYVPQIADCINHGSVTFTGTASTDSHCCGITYYAKEMTNCKNGRADYPELEAGKLEYKSKNGKSVFLGGLARQIFTKAEDCINYGNLYISETTNGTIYVGGMVAAGNDVESTTASTFRSCSNKGNIYINADIAPTKNNNCFVGGFTYRNLCPYVFEDCHNEGDIILKENIAIGNSIRMGGFVGTLESKHNITFDSCSNSGDIIVNKGVICGNSSSGNTGYVRIGGIVGNQSSGTITVKNYVKNTGNIQMSAETKHNQNIMVGGLIAYTAAAFTEDSDAVLINEGKVECDGATKKGFRVGGVFGGSSAVHPATVSYVNTGDITLTGTYNSSADAYVGGVFGNTSTSQANAKSFCTINAIGYTGVGAITGSHYAAGTVELSNCAAGGTMNSKMIQIEEASGTIEEIGPGALTATNWYENFYGNAVEETVLINAGCSLLTEKPSTAIPTPSEPEVTE